MDYPTNRDLDGVYLRTERNGQGQSLCFTDLTAEEQDAVTEHWTKSQWRWLALHLAGRLRELGDQLDVVTKGKDELTDKWEDIDE